jgi:hypothetical protein
VGPGQNPAASTSSGIAPPGAGTGPGTGTWVCTGSHGARASRPAGQVRHRSEDPGRRRWRSCRPRYREGPGALSSADPAGRTESAASICASLEGPRAASERSRRGDEARFVLRRSRSAAGGAPSEGVPGGGAAGHGGARRPRRRSRSPGEEGDRSRRARGVAEDGVQRLGAVVAQQRQPGARGAGRGGGRGEPRAGKSSGSPRDLAGPDPAAGNWAVGRWSCRGGRVGQPVGCDVRAEGIATLGPAGRRAATGRTGGRFPDRAGGATGSPGTDTGPATSAVAGEDATGWTVGVLGSSRSTTGRSTSARVCGTAALGGPADHARCSPCGPAPQSATRRTSEVSRDGRLTG